MAIDERFAIALEAFGRALARFDEVLALPEDDIVRDAVIKRFEFTFEAGWKAAYRWLRARGIDLGESAYEVLNAAFSNRLIGDATGWRDLRQCRNRTAHIYNEANAVQVAAYARGEARRLLGELFDTLKARADE